MLSRNTVFLNLLLFCQRAESESQHINAFWAHPVDTYNKGRTMSLASAEKIEEDEEGRLHDCRSRNLVIIILTCQKYKFVTRVVSLNFRKKLVL